MITANRIMIGSAVSTLLWIALLVSVIQSSILAWVAIVILMIAGVIFATHQGWIDWPVWWVYVMRYKLQVIIPAVLAVFALGFTVWAGLATRGAPMAFFYLWWFVGVVVATIGVNCLRDQEYRGRVAYVVGNWIGRGGFWFFWRADNLPANSLLCLYLFLVLNTVAYGPPTPGFDRADVIQQVKVAVNGVSEVEQINLVVNTAKELGNLVSLTLAGKEYFDTSTGLNFPKLEVKALPPLYRKGPGLMFATIITLPVMLVGLVFSRRDGAAAVIEAVVNKVRPKEQDPDPKASTKPEENRPRSVADVVKNQGVKFVDLVWSEVLGKLLVEGGESFVKFLRKQPHLL